MARKRTRRFETAQSSRDEIEPKLDLDLETLEMTEDVLADFSLDELREFLEADLLEVPVDSEFKERLREYLWELVQQNARPRDGGQSTN